MAKAAKKRTTAKKSKRRIKSIARKHSAEVLRQVRTAARARRLLGRATDNESEELVKMAMVC
jgi:hypothetical protein